MARQFTALAAVYDDLILVCDPYADHVPHRARLLRVLA